MVVWPDDVEEESVPEAEEVSVEATEEAVAALQPVSASESR